MATEALKEGLLVFVRHGQSEWNASNQFTGWVDVDLTELGVKEAQAGAEALKGYEFDVVYTSVLKRAIKTSNIVLEGIDQLWLPVIRSWRLNERMYGGLQGLNKVETVEKHGKEQVLIWRRSFDVPPPEIADDSEYNPANDRKYAEIGAENIPKTECLKDVIERAVPFFESDILPALRAGKRVLVAAHGNSIRAFCKYLDNVPDAVIPSLEIPTGIPLVYKFDAELKPIKAENAFGPLSGFFVGDPVKIQKAMDKVKNQIAKK